MDSHPNPQSFRNFVKQWKYLIICYGERNEGKVYVKVDGNLLPISQILSFLFRTWTKNHWSH